MEITNKQNKRLDMYRTKDKKEKIKLNKDKKKTKYANQINNPNK